MAVAALLAGVAEGKQPWFWASAAGVALLLLLLNVLIIVAVHADGYGLSPRPERKAFATDRGSLASSMGLPSAQERQEEPVDEPSGRSRRMLIERSGRRRKEPHMLDAREYGHVRRRFGRECLARDVVPPALRPVAMPTGM